MIKVEIICSKYKSFWQKPNDHKQGYGCPICSTSKGEKRIFNYLINNNINFTPQKYFKELGRQRFDFYLKEYNTCIEFDGRQHFEKLSIVQERDQRKNQYCKDTDINLILIPYWDIDNIETIIKGKI